VLKSRANSGDENALFYSIPWTGDTRAIFYRRDALKKAGIDENSGFSNIDEFKNTISTLKENGFPAPLVLTTRRSSLTVHYVATWIWNTGGEFLSVDGSRITFDDEPAMEGCKAFFHLGEYIDDQEKMRDEDQTNHSFRTGKSVVNLSGPWMLNLDLFSPDVRENLGVMPIPGTPFVGGQDFVIWKHSRHIPAARKLIGYLHSDEAGKLIYPLYGLPVSETMWETAPFNTGFYSIFLSAIQKGRSLHGQLWGLVEKRLTDEYAEIWAEILKTQPTQWDTIIETRMKNLAHRLQLSMGD
jgi:multiple sugar transport system substrate-binding protein